MEKLNELMQQELPSWWMNGVSAVGNKSRWSVMSLAG